MISTSFRADVRDASVLVRTELQVRLRRLLGDRRKLAATGFTLLLFGGFVPVWLFDRTVAFGGELASGDPPVGTTGAVFTGLAVTAGYLGGASGFNQEEMGSVGPLVRTSIPPTAASLARFASDMARAVGFVVPGLVVLLVELTLGTGSLVVSGVFAVAALPVLLAALVVGRLVGDALRYLNATLSVSLWTKALLFVAVTAVAFAGSQLFFLSAMDGTEEPLEAFTIPVLLPGAPVQAYAAVVLEPLGATGRALGLPVAAVLLAAIPLALFAALGLETRLLFRDASAERGTPVGSRGVPRPFAWSPAGRVAWRYLLRTRRDPRTLAHLMPLLFGALGLSATFVQDPGSLFTLGPAAAVIGGSTLAGTAYCLNPLGDDVDQLPLLLTSTGLSGALLRGRVVAGSALGLALAVGVGTPLALVEQSVLYAVWQTFLAVVLAVAGCGVALGIGALFPKFERREYVSVERPHPSNYAVFGFFFGGLLVGGVGVLLVHFAAGQAPDALVAAAWAAYLAVVCLPGLGGYVFAVRKFDALSMDDV